VGLGIKLNSMSEILEVYQEPKVKLLPSLVKPMDSKVEERLMWV